MIRPEWVVMLQGRSACSVHYADQTEIERIAKTAQSQDTRVVDGPRARTAWEAMSLKDKVARGLKLD